MSEKEADENAIRAMMAGKQMCYTPQSDQFREFLFQNLVHDKGDCIETEWLQKFSGEQWFQRELKNYGLNV